ncbi:peptidoglycan DD-metalloendopeptidase family protein [Microvirga sp. STR05]|uniref:Peptidoglycan DD-metalloendopeptidase family protein n=1 Tax=Hymenobacter duratus TaxID=2771356 RepID=A0ABR8JQ32_9BACT|nr:peptidoglycan DD-metalloendopeptidase family protein [Hymenobacter duratus]MBD2716909.1 peptidoglycan DD-metalloendopeptidase family protein [Hymenobacter duratus]MBR7951825.1 peptidoglycan DD-metalloendopeptidase family protein [Microvirga sp. STR05]
MPYSLRSAFYLSFFLLLAACGKQQTLQGIFQKSTPHEAYARKLRQAGLDQTALGRDWLAAADRALRDSLVVTLPFEETGYFAAERAIAAAFRYQVRAGETVRISLTLDKGADARVFLDAFELDPERRATRPLASADTTALAFSYLAEDDRQHLLRVQPELLRTGRFTLRIQRAPSLSFPVRGKNDVAVGSFWGVDRDGGARRHEGIDIFAKRGTPAVASANGYITRVNETPLGGRVVWLMDTEHGQHLYYAHLDKQLVQPGQQVRIGDTLGLVGNTGNARTTPPHLHFGVYRSGRGAVDPFPFVRRPDTAPATPRTAPERLGQWVRVQDKRIDLRRGPVAKEAAVASVGRNTPLLVVGSQTNWYRVQHPDGRFGYVPAKAVVPASTPLRQAALTDVAILYTLPQSGSASLDSLPARSSVAVLGEFGGYRLVRSATGRLGWIVLAAS